MEWTSAKVKNIFLEKVHEVGLLLQIIFHTIVGHLKTTFAPPTFRYFE